MIPKSPARLAAANPGVIYVCNPNNPTGTITPRKDIEYIVANAPKDTVILIDEAYIHLSDATPSLDFVKDGKNVIVLRTFSKLYGMAGLRLGFRHRPPGPDQKARLLWDEFAARHDHRCREGQPGR